MDIEKIKKFNSELIEKKITICCAESITAGLLASTIASIPGASSVLKGSIVTYNPELKISILGVKPETLFKHSAESIETTVEMVNGLVKTYSNAELYVAVTGVASEPLENSGVIKKWGQVYIAIYYNNEIYETDKIIDFIKTDEIEIRNEIREKTVDLILEKILEVIYKPVS
ncbi:nicotinamide-nucleotide amidohydrolase family protein [Flavobacterium psychroterrae]|uniref:Nicotinamide-nucleotide amidohydrolase family protein n=1 Tax=Flavobacterium psychroterrae TaxID=2133767 RepID=A0ABS5PFH6_9FLAO|nr:nicotinamide-nucleotide amidohydrolase family protein [Flavobacterium psychroterrae]MBS7233058.1 nicotinamide-nucleotide amidohydrolase family protein [Flavobacterium psychroterrae]